MIKNISAWKISSLNEYSVQIRLGSNLGGFFLFQEEGGCLWQKKWIRWIQMKDLQDSIKKYGIITPVIVRPRKEGYYEIISGYRRIFAAEKLGYE